MKYFKDTKNGQVYAYESDGSQDAYILPDLVQMTDAEVQLHLAEPPAPIPTLNPRQIRFVLNNANLRNKVESMVSQSDQTTKDWWEFSQQYEHDHPVLVSMANNLGLTSQQVQQMFIDGAKL